jgi:GTPase SAR1 family protein
MLTALKRLVNNNNNSNDHNSSAAVATPNQQLQHQLNDSNNNSPESKNKTDSQTMPNNTNKNGMISISQSLQKKFSRGVNYNMKIVIKGDYNVGKTCLWLRLQGEPFQENYKTSEEIKVANIQWKYKQTEDIVKVEIWDVVDRSKKKRNLLEQSSSTVAKSTPSSLKLDNNIKKKAAIDPNISIEASLDAEFIDVYKNTNGVLLVYDITKQWTWDYIEREIPKIPVHIPILIIGNHRDLHHHRNVDELKCRLYIEELQQSRTTMMTSTIRYIETSMRNGFGLKYLYNFFNVPFLQLQRETLMQQLEINAKEMDKIVEELEGDEESCDDQYDLFTDGLNAKRRQQQEANAKDVLKNAKPIEEARRIAAEKEAARLKAEEEAASEPKKVKLKQINCSTRIVISNF